MTTRYSDAYFAARESWADWRIEARLLVDLARVARDARGRPHAMPKIATGRPATLSLRGMVTSPHSLASAAGVEVLRAGGSAVDAASAASAVLSVVYPHMTGLGGDAFWLIHDARQGSVRYLGAAGRAAAAATLEWFRSRGFDEIPLEECGYRLVQHREVALAAATESRRSARPNPLCSAAAESNDQGDFV